ncbi:MAG: FAD-dependent oxidoreductase [Anaerolineae bacterium]|nr:FAD-dependent oxidoreductase [Anaerolineae bacterium]
MPIERDTGEWSFETEVVVIGGGGCGLTAAVAAGQLGVEVLVLEKQETPLSNTQRSYGMIPAGGTRFQKAAGVEETPEDFTQDILNKNHHQGDYDTTLHITRTIVDVVHWLVDDVGAELYFVDDFLYPGHSRHRMHAPPNRSGAELYEALRAKLATMDNVEVIKGAPVSALIADEDGVVLGVKVERGNQVERVKAQKVILAANGFGGSEELVEKYIPAMRDALYLGGEGNTGEGILWGQELGAETAFMDSYQAHGSVAIPYNVLITYAMVAEGGIQVNKQGQRFGTELQGYSERALDVLQQPDGLAWMIYPQRLHELGMTFEEYRTAHEAGAIKVADTPQALAEIFGIDAAAFAETIRAYNAAADGEISDPMGRGVCKRIDPPYYGVKVTGTLFHTQGGLKVDEHARVLKPDGSTVPNLYAGGGTAAGLSGHGAAGYLSGNGLLAALGYGYLAGKHAAISIQEGAPA